MPLMSALGTSRTTSCVSSAARGRASIARYHQIAKGNAAKMPKGPFREPIAALPGIGGDVEEQSGSGKSLSSAPPRRTPRGPRWR